MKRDGQRGERNVKKYEDKNKSEVFSNTKAGSQQRVKMNQGIRSGVLERSSKRFLSRFHWGLEIKTS